MADQLQDMTDEQLSGLIEDAQAEQQRRQKAKRQKALDEAKAILSAAGLSLRDALAGSGGSGKKKAAGKPALKQGQRYVNPANSSQVYTTGRGRPPKWFSDLQARGNLPEPSPAGNSPGRK